MAQTVHEIWLCPGRFFPIFPIFLSPDHAQVHHAAYCLAAAIHTNRTLVFSAAHWRYSRWPPAPAIHQGRPRRLLPPCQPDVHRVRPRWAGSRHGGRRAGGGGGAGEGPELLAEGGLPRHQGRLAPRHPRGPRPARGYCGRGARSMVGLAAFHRLFIFCSSDLSSENIKHINTLLCFSS